MVVAGGVCVIAAAVLISAGQPLRSHELASLAAPYESEARPRDNVPLTARLDVETRTDATVPVAQVTREPSRPDVMPRKTAAVEPITATAVVSTPKAPAVQRAAQTSAAGAPKAEAATPALAAPKPPAVELAAAESGAPAERGAEAVATITGCLAFEHQTFWLKDTSGANAPKTRSWRSGFLRHRAAPVEVVDASGTLKLASHVGQRVAATGTLVDREMRPRSLQRVAASCS